MFYNAVEVFWRNAIDLCIVLWELAVHGVLVKSNGD